MTSSDDAEGATHETRRSDGVLTGRRGTLNAIDKPR
jgi:hypothetical protein